MRLHDAFARALLDPKLPPPDGLFAPDRVSVERRFAVHRNTFVSGMIDSLFASFPVVAALVGPAFFRWMARAYVLERPPTSPLPIEHALGFPDFIDAFEPAAAIAYLTDVSRLEALRLRACHAKDEAVVDPATLGALAGAPERLWRARVRLHSSAFCLESPYAVRSLWEAHQVDSARLAQSVAAVDVDLSEGALVYRPASSVLVQPLPDGAGTFLAALEAGNTLGEALDTALRQSPSAPAGALLNLLLAGAAMAFYEDELEASSAD